jgi:hypothetical protein
LEVPQDPLVGVVVGAQVVLFQVVPVVQVACTVLESRVRVPDTRVKELVPYASTRGVEDPVNEEENSVVPWRTEREVMLEDVQDTGIVQLDDPDGMVQEVGSEMKDAVGVGATVTD